MAFFTTYYSKQTGDEIHSCAMIAKHYIFKGEFVIDFLSTFPFG